MPVILAAVRVLLFGAAGFAVAVLVMNWPSRLDLRVAMRYLKSRRSSRLLSLITVIAVGGVTVGVAALGFRLGGRNGMPDGLRAKILVVNPQPPELTYG